MGPRDCKGYVYLFRLNEFYKIGCSMNPRVRVSGRESLPGDVGLIHMIPVINRHSMEAVLHERYASKRAKGEWFLLSNEDVEEIQGLMDEASVKRLEEHRFTITVNGEELIRLVQQSEKAGCKVVQYISKCVADSLAKDESESIEIT